MDKKEECFMIRTICIYFLLFFTYSVIGWCNEVIRGFYFEHKFVNRGFLIGPYCPIYGFGAIIITLFLNKYLNDPLILFVMAMVDCSVLEYATSYFFEKLYHARWWGYSSYKFNINGRICLETMVPFGIGGLIAMYYVNPFLLNLFSNIPTLALYIISGFLFIALITDNAISFSIMNKIKNISKETQRHQIMMRDDTERITLLVRKQIEKSKKVLQKRMIHAFPHLQLLRFKNLDK